MTLRSRRKRPTTALTSSQAKCLRSRLSAAEATPGKATRRIALAFSLMLGGPWAVAQQPGEAPWASARHSQATTTRVTAGRPVASTMTLQPVARFGEEPARPAAKPQQRPGWQLRWRSPDSANSDASPAVATVSATAEGPQDQEASGILQAAFQSPDEQENSLQLPETLELPSEDEPGDPTNPDIFERPFENFPPSPTTPPSADAMEEVQPSAPADPPEATTPPSPSDLGPVPSNPMRSQSDSLDVPPYRANPFPQRDRSDRGTDGADREDRRPVPRTVEGLIPGTPGRRNVYSCDDIRERLNERTIDKVSLDISPPFRPDMIDEAEFQRTLEEFLERQEVREWHSVDGAVMARGRLKDLAYQQVIIEAEHGGTEAFPIDRISEGDLAYISEHWGLPQECRIERVVYQPRQWVPSTLTWKASALCHKPAYFEEVNLERYGHTAGPLAQPVISSAHFFFNIAVLPYKAGIHPPSECQYTLGYYRPGSCAPWILPPVPISLRGAVTQATVVGAGVGFIP